MLITAGLPAEHDWHDQFGIELDDLGSEHSLRADPTVVALWRAAGLLGDDNWIAARLPGEYEGEAERKDGQVTKQWTTVVFGEDELNWLKDVLQFNAADDRGQNDDVDLGPLA